VQPELLASLRRLSDTELVARVQDLTARERGATVLLVAHLAELDTRDVHYRAGHGSLFAYCRDVLGLSEQEAYNRIAVARAARRFPVILDLLEGGALHLTSVRLLAPHLTPANHRSVLESARGQTRVQVEEIAAALWPRPDAPPGVRKLPAPRPLLTSQPAPVAASASPAEAVASASTRAAASDLEAAVTAGDGSAAVEAASPSDVPKRPAAVTPSGVSNPLLPGARPSAALTPLSPDRYRVQVTIGAETLEKLRLAKDLLRHAVPSGDEALILDRALTALLTDLAQKKFAAAASPRPAAAGVSGSRHVPAEVKRKVWLRDLGRCAFVGTSGRRCSERAFLEFHHVKPHALGGEASVENIQLRCRNHNAYEARLYFALDDGNGGAGSVAEARAAYGGSPATCNGFGRAEAGGARFRVPGTRSGTSAGVVALPGPAP
jgi:hypothetical protein